MTELKKLKRAVIKEEYIAITGDFQKAVILNQFIYWSERVSDFDEFIRQENNRATQHGFEEQELTNGWIYKTAEELSEETMLGLSSASMRSHIKALIDLGFISERNNPKYKWDRTKQYRVDLVAITKALMNEGFVLEGYKINLPFLEIKNGNGENSTAIPKTTSNTTTKTNNTKKEGKKETTYDSILTAVEDDGLRDLYYEYIKMRKLIKSPMTDRALTMLIKKVNELEPADINRQKRLLETAIMNNWKSVYPLKDNDKTGGFNNGSPNGDTTDTTNKARYGVTL